MQQSSLSAPPRGAGRDAAAGGNPVWAYLGALLIGAALAAAVFPAEFVLGSVHLVHPPEGDMAKDIVGQRYYIADAWRWPLLQAANLFIPDGVNIAFVDAIPIVAVPLKLFAPLLPPAFHGIGLWYAAAWLLQPVAAVWCLRGAGERRLLPALAAATLAVSMPAWWDRFGHAALCGQFLLLVGLGFYCRLVRRPRPRLWAAAVGLLTATLFVHPYLAFMVLGLIGSAPLTLACRGDARWRAGALWVAAGMAALVGGMALFGYLGATGGTGFGIYAMDLLSPLWPARSALLPVELARLDASGGPGFEGYNYLGAGLLLGLAAAAAVRPAAVARMLRRHLGLAAALGGMTLFALSQKVAFAGHVVLDLGSVPAWLENLRSTGRFFWPVAYAALVAVVLVLARHPDRRVGAALVVTVAALQFADAARLRQGLREHLHSPRAAWAVDAFALRPLLAQAGSLTLVPSWHCVPAANPAPEQNLLMNLIVLASEVNLPVSTMYLARWKGDLRCLDGRLAAAPLGGGELRLFTPAAQADLLPRVPRREELCFPVGQLAACRDPAAAEPPPTRSAVPPPAPLAEGEVSFAQGAAGTDLLGRGWSGPEPEGVWSNADSAVLELNRPADLAGPLRLEFGLQGFAPDGDATQDLELRWRGAVLGRWALRDRQRTTVAAVLPPGVPGLQVLEFRVGSPSRPSDRGLSADSRRLGVMLHRARVSRADPWPVLATGSAGFGAGAPGTALLGFGWSSPEEASVWSEAETAELHFVRPPDLSGPAKLEFEAEGLGPAAGEPQAVEVSQGGNTLARWELPDRQRTRVSVLLPPGPPGPASLTFAVGSPTRPADRGLGGDGRTLGVRLWRLHASVDRPVPWLAAGRHPLGNGRPGAGMLGEGWAEAGPEEARFAGGRATLRFRRPASLTGQLALDLELRRDGHPDRTTEPRLELRLWGRRLGEWALGDAPTARVSARLPAGPAEETELELRVVGSGPGELALEAACVEPLRYRRAATAEAAAASACGGQQPPAPQVASASP